MRSRKLTAISALPLAAALGCELPPEEPIPVPPPTLVACVGTPFTPSPAQGFDHWGSEIIALATPGHSMQDVISTPGAAVVIHGKFAYGSVSKDLEGEKVRVHLDACDGWRSLGEMTTDSDGRIAFTVSDELPVGVYDVRLEVLGDATVAPGRIWILPEGTHIAVSDIDGTLTTSDEELVEDVFTDLFEPIFSGDDVPSAWPGGARLTHALGERAWVVVYLTGRPYWLTGKTRDWLAAGGFALGALHTTDSNAEAIPVESGVGAFKLAYLQSLIAQGFVVDQAYGNATTDIYAYAGAGIALDRTWIIGPHAGEGGTNAVDGSWQPRADEILAGPEVAQPFTR
jgi:phosphatidate phosphatase PAH1